MKAHPIPMSAPMVRALLAGTKTQTRRPVKLPHTNPLGQWEPVPWGGLSGGRLASGETVPAQTLIGHSRTGEILGCPYGQPGDRLWVREAWRASRDLNSTPPRDIPPDSSIEFEATKRSYAEIGLTGKLRPGMFMPRWASRITLEVTGVRVERLQDISQADAAAEGVVWEQGQTAANVFETLWESINGPDSWAANPWVWVVEFKQVQP